MDGSTDRVIVREHHGKVMGTVGSEASYEVGHWVMLPGDYILSRAPFVCLFGILLTMK